MKIAILGIIFFCLLSCKQNDGTEGMPESFFPPGSEIKAYDDIPGLVRVIVPGVNGKIAAEGDFMNGYHHGPWIEYDTAKGWVTSIQNYYMGRKQGPSFEFDRGRLSSKEYYASDVLNGQSLKFSAVGVIEEKNYDDGRLDGAVRKFYPRNGKLMEESFYIDGQIDGLAKWYDQEGNLSFQYLYKNGELIDQNPGDSVGD
jgi:antitoxin component YwqK of YwqJK toxin-antitoxin module